MRSRGLFASPGGDPASLERRLRQSASSRTEAADPELRRVLLRVAERRSARSRPGVGLLTGAELAPSPSAAPPASIEDAPSLTPSEPQTRLSPVTASSPPGTLLDVTRVSNDVRILRFARPRGLSFSAGQHVKIGIPSGSSNPYTIASAPHEPHLEFCIEQVPGGKVSPRLFALSPGSRVALGNKVKGSFLLVEKASVHLMIATVTGIAPFVSMLRDVAHRGSWPGRFVVLHGASFADELPYTRELTALASRFSDHLEYVPSVSRPADARNRSWSGQTGRVAELAPSFAQKLSDGASPLHAYACGNPGMVASVREQLGALGIPVSTEAFK